MALLKSVGGFALSVSLMTVLLLIFNYLDKVILSGQLTLIQYGYYSAAWQMASVLYLLYMPIYTAYYPVFTQLHAKNDEDGLQSAFHRASQLMAILIIPTVTVIGVFAPEVLHLWTSAALNALATSLTNDWYLPYFAPKRSEAHHIGAARWFTVFFAVLMVVIASVTAYDNVKNPGHSLIPIALGVPALFIGPMGGVFLLGMVTRRRGSDGGNVVAITAGLLGVFYLSGTHLKLIRPLAEAAWGQAVGLPAFVRFLESWAPIDIGFTWYAFLGVGITFLVGVLFATPEDVVTSAARKRIDAMASTDDKPISMRG